MIEWLLCNKTDAVSILEQYWILHNVSNALQSQCLSFFESSDVEYIEFVFADCDIKTQLLLTDLIKYMLKSDEQIWLKLAFVIIDCIQNTWKLIKKKCECHFWSRNIQFLHHFHSSDIHLFTSFLSDFTLLIISSCSDLEHLLYLSSFMWDNQNSLQISSIKNLDDNICWIFSIILLKISDWRSFRNFLSHKKNLSKLEMSSVISKFEKTLYNIIYVLKSIKIDKIVKFCLNEDHESQDTVSDYCKHIKQMLLK